MHYEILVEDGSGARVLEAVVPKIISPEHSFKVHSYKGLGHLPKGLKVDSDPKKRLLLQQLPRLVQGLGTTFFGWGPTFRAVLVVICDLDSRCKIDFKAELREVVNSCMPRPETLLCFAVEEIEAWLLGDKSAILEAYPEAVEAVLDSYEYDSICGTWELLADAIYPGGRKSLKQGPYQIAGSAKAEWATRIAPRIVVDRNISPSFIYLRDMLRAFTS
jgi:hypothetical protein